MSDQMITHSNGIKHYPSEFGGCPYCVDPSKAKLKSLISRLEGKNEYYKSKIVDGTMQKDLIGRIQGIDEAIALLKEELT